MKFPFSSRTSTESRLSTAASVAVSVVIAATTITSSMPILPTLQYNTASDIPKQYIQDHKVIKGRVVKITDGDTFRIRHHPFPFWSSDSYTGPLSQNTISVRVYGVDAPELAKRGNPSMPQAEEARDFTRNLVDGKVVKVKLLRRDQYGRIVGKVTTNGLIPYFSTKDVSVELAKNGYGTLYTQGGAEYDNNLETLQKSIEQAKKKKKGVWVNGPENVLSPAEYKAKLKAKISKSTN